MYHRAECFSRARAVAHGFQTINYLRVWCSFHSVMFTTQSMLFRIVIRFLCEAKWMDQSQEELLHVRTLKMNYWDEKKNQGRLIQVDPNDWFSKTVSHFKRHHQTYDWSYGVSLISNKNEWKFQFLRYCVRWCASTKASKEKSATDELDCRWVFLMYFSKYLFDLTKFSLQL